jgi:hypothetical protein
MSNFEALALRISLPKIFSIFLLFTVALVAVAEPPTPELYKMLPRDVGGFHQLLSMRPLVTLAREGILSPSFFRLEPNQNRSPFIGAEVEYLSPAGEKLTVEIIRVTGESDAYAFLTLVAKKMREAEPTQRLTMNGVGTASVVSPRQVAFFKGTTFLRVTDADPDSRGSKDVLALARLFADLLEKGDGDIPVLVKHLPDWQNAQSEDLYAVNLETLKGSVPSQPILDVVSFEGAEAVVANYGGAQLAIIEFSTPQFAGDNDRSIAARLQELRNQGHPVPTAYRRVGNYAVFVFNGQSEQAASQLIDQIKYEQVVRWLGDNPYFLQEAQRKYVETTLGVFVSVVKASGLALVSCLAVGGFLGALLFSRRRAQQRAIEAFSDAGGMLRLNLDEMTPQNDPARLIGPGN